MRFFILIFFLMLTFSSASVTYYVCSPGQFFDLQHCETCLANCVCSSMNTCDSCVSGYTAYNGQCIQCPQTSGIYGTCSSCCSKTSGTQISCTDCMPVVNSYTFLYSGRCIVSPGCFEIDNNGFCTECFPGFYEINNICYACDASCATCTDSTNCLTCSPGYYWGIANGGLCTTCPSGCASCNAAGTCSGCLANYYLFQTHCLSCPTDCSSCSDGSTCTTCSAGILVSNLCIRCTDLTYGGSVGCTTCSNNNNFIACSQCADTYFLSSTGVCQSCSSVIPGALRCSDTNTPTQCQNDFSSTLTLRYYLVGITCIQNVKSCRKISDIYGNCSQCYSGYKITSGACVQCSFTGCDLTTATVTSNVCTCVGCLSGYYLTGVTCTACADIHCTTCTAAGCTICNQGYYLTGITCTANALSNCAVSLSVSVCTTCAVGFYKGSDNLCHACQSTCATCTARFVCTTCIANYFLNTTSHSCVQMPSNCLTLSATYACTLCQYGYYLSNGFCLACKV
jgi:proprotein convertase subtilisin/kexin type 5